MACFVLCEPYQLGQILAGKARSLPQREVKPSSKYKTMQERLARGNAVAYFSGASVTK
jgi:hypothetical protein